MCEGSRPGGRYLPHHCATFCCAHILVLAGIRVGGSSWLVLGLPVRLGLADTLSHMCMRCGMVAFGCRSKPPPLVEAVGLAAGLENSEKPCARKLARPGHAGVGCAFCHWPVL